MDSWSTFDEHCHKHSSRHRLPCPVGSVTPKPAESAAQKLLSLTHRPCVHAPIVVLQRATTVVRITPKQLRQTVCG